MGKLILAALLCLPALAQYTPPSGGGSSTPSGPAGGSLAGSYPNPTLANPLVNSGIVQVGDTPSLTPFMAIPTLTFLGYGGEFIGGGLNDLSLPDATSGYSGAAPGVFIIKISSTGTPDQFQWAKGSGAFSSGIAITGGSQTISEGLIIKFAATTGHTANNQWIIPTAAGMIWPATLSETGKSGGTAALGSGAGSVTNGAHVVKYSWATSQGDSYLSTAGTVTVINNAVNGKINLTGIPQSSSPLFIGTNVWITKAGGTTLYLAAFVPVGTTSYTFNAADSALVNTAPAYLDTLTSAGGCIYGEVAGLGLGQCGLQFFDYGLRFPLQNYFFDKFANGLLGTTNNLLTTLTALPSGTTATTQSASDNSTKVSTTAYVDTALSGVVRTSDTGTVTNTMLAGSIANNKLSNSSMTIGGASCTLGSSCIPGTITGASLVGQATVINTSAGASASVAYAPTTGNTVIVVCPFMGFNNSAPTSPTMTDGGTNTYTNDDSYFATSDLSSSRYAGYYVWRSSNVTGGSFTMTCGLTQGSGGDVMGIYVTEWTGIATSSPLDGTPVHATVTSTSYADSGALTTTNASDVLIGIYVLPSSVGVAMCVPSSLFQFVGGDNASGFVPSGVFSRNVASTGSRHATCTPTIAIKSIVGQLAYKLQ